MFGIIKQVQGWAKIKGATTGTMIGNIEDSLKTMAQADLYSSFSPDPTNILVGRQPKAMDARGRMETHATVLTDEGSFRDDFPGTSLNTTITGTMTFTNGSDSVIGVGTLFTQQIRYGMFIKKTSDGETLWAKVSYVVSDTEIVLVSNYTGTTATVAGHVSYWRTSTGGTGSFSVLNSLATINSGTAIGTNTLYRDADYGPFTCAFKAAVGQRVANQTITIGVQDAISSVGERAVFQFTGTDNTQAMCISGSSGAASDTQTTIITLPNNLTSTTYHEFVINVSNDQVTFVCNGVTVAVHRDHVVGAYDFLQTVAQVTNTAVVTNTAITVDWHNFYNINQVEIANSFVGEPLSIAPVSIIERPVASYSASAGPFVAAATPTDIFTITGSATKVIRIKKIYFGASATNATTFNFLLVKRSTGNTGGTSTVLTAVPNDSDDVAATAVVRGYTANPTALGTSVGTIRAYRLVVPQTAPLGGASNGPLNEVLFGDNSSKSIALRGTSESLSLNLNAVTLTGNSFCVFIEWTEETT